MSAMVYGILGGMGPLASAEFLKTIYEIHEGRPEQEMPVVLVRSDPRVRDRTATLLKDPQDRELLAELELGLSELVRMGADEIVICCFTTHLLLSLVREDLRAKVVPLLDLTFDELERSSSRHLLVCTTGSRRLGLFERHPRWAGVTGRVACPDEDDQEAVHRWIYEIKKGRDAGEMLPFLAGLGEKYGTGAFIAGCTEIHLVAKRLQSSGGSSLSWVDPLTTLARRWRGATPSPG